MRAAMRPRSVGGIASPLTSPVKAEAAAVVELLKVRPDFTVETLAQDGAQYSGNPTFRKEFQRIVEGARTAGLLER